MANKNELKQGPRLGARRLGGGRYLSILNEYAKHNTRLVAAVAVVFVFGVTGLTLMSLSRAATSTVAIEAESGAKTGTAAGDAAGASGGASVKFSPVTTGGGGSPTGGTPGLFSKLRWVSGVHADNPVAQDEAFGTWRGRPIDLINTFTGRENWGTLINPFFLDQYKAFQAKGGIWEISQPLFPDGGDYGACASGAYNDNWKQFGNTIVSNGMNNNKTIVRLGWEFNLGSALNNAGTYKSCFVNARNALKSVATNVVIDWTVAGNGGDPNLFTNFYPGDQYVDIIGTDWYDAYHDPITDQASFDASCNSAMKLGPCFFAEQAKARGKKFSVGEWGVTQCSGGTNLRDNDVYITLMAKMFDKYKDVLAYEAYYDDTAGGNVCSSVWKGQNPKAAAAYKLYFGAGSEFGIQ